MSKVWVVIFADAVRDKLINSAKEGRFSVANHYQFELQGLIDKMKSTVESHGGSMPFCNPDFIATEIPVDVAAELPDLIEGFTETAGDGLAIGVGLDFQEAAMAAKKSYKTGKIELFNPADTYQEKIQKTANSRTNINQDVSLPINLFDPEQPDDKPYQKVIDQKSNPVPKRMSLKESMSAEAQFIQAINEMLGAGEIEQAAQQQQQMMQQQAQQQQQPQNEDDSDAHANTNTTDLLGQLSGQPQQQSSAGADQGQEDGGDAEEAAQEVTQEVDDATKEAAADHNQELMDKLKDVKSQIPQIMAMASKDPKAFQQTMSMIQKLITSAKQVQKAEQDLGKSGNKASGPQAMSGIRFPVGTRKGNYKKVLVNGKEIWRSMASGQVLAPDGTDISVKANNQQQKAKQQ
jgi:hypothetical protein